MVASRYDVFLSYSRTDSERVLPLRDALQSLGYLVFFDVQSIKPGDPWKERLECSIRASRTLVLCWSANAEGSDYIAFEYARAEALHKPVIPWLLDSTPLPAMLEVQAITTPDAGQAAAALRPALGWTLAQRHILQRSVAALLAALVVSAVFWMLRPAAPWDLQGEVTDRVTSMPIVGVEVSVLSGNRVTASTLTDAQGHYDLRLPAPQPHTVHVRFRKEGYEAEEPMNIPAAKPWNMDMMKVR